MNKKKVPKTITDFFGKAQNNVVVNENEQDPSQSKDISEEALILHKKRKFEESPSFKLLNQEMETR